MNEQQVIDLIAESLEIDPSTLTMDTRIADVEDWTSIGWLTIMSSLDDRGVQLGASDIRSFKTVSDVVNFVATKASAAN